ncbi:MAG: metal-dependent transcriptional regulator [Acidobacteriota bacterium]
MEKLSRSLEDYLESIYIISLKKKIVRVKDIVNRMGVRSSSVIGAMKKLSSGGYIEHEHYGHIDMTATGLKRAERLYEKHKTLTRFFNDILNVKKEIAEEDACAIEHYISDETYYKIIKLIQHIESSKDTNPKWLEDLKILVK